MGTELTKKNEQVYCGIDFHKNTSTFVALSQDGKPIEKVTTIRTKEIIRYFSNRTHWKIGIEATGGVNQVVEDLKSLGIEVVIFNSNQFRGIGIGGKKTDERDCLALAECLRLNFVPEVHHKSRFSRELKTLLVQREILVRTRVNMMNHVRGTLREYGINIPAGAEIFYSQAKEKINELKQPLLGEGLKFLLNSIFELKQQEKLSEENIEKMLDGNPQVENLLTIPGVGLMTAAAMICVIDEISRFKSAKVFASYLGLTPSVHASANVRMMGSITRSGSELLRRYLIHGARAWMRYDAESDKHRIWAEKVKERRGMNKAVVALAHRISRICYAVLRDGTQYKGKAKKKFLKKIQGETDAA